MAGKKVSHAALGVNVTPAENGGALVANVVAERRRGQGRPGAG